MMLLVPPPLWASGLRDVEIFSDTVAQATTIAWPGGLQAGDVAFLFDHGANAATPPTRVTPSDFTVIYEVTDTVCSTVISWKILNGSESGSITGMSGNNPNKSLYILRGSKPVQSVSIPTVNSEVTSSNPSPQTVVASAETPPLAVFGFTGTRGSEPSFTTETPAFDTVLTRNRSRSGCSVYNAAPSDHTVDMGGIASTNILVSFFALLN